MKTWEKKLLQKGLMEMSEIIVKSDINKYLYNVLGNNYMVDSWWHTENFHFDFNTPEEVYQSGDQGRQKVYEYVSNAFERK